METLYIEPSRTHRKLLESIWEDRTVDLKQYDGQRQRHTDPCIEWRYAQLKRANIIKLLDS